MNTRQIKALSWSLLILVVLIISWYFYTSHQNDISWYDSILNYEVEHSDNEKESFILNFLSERNYIRSNYRNHPTQFNNSELLFYEGVVNNNIEQIEQGLRQTKNINRLFDLSFLFFSISPLTDAPEYKLPAHYQTSLFYKRIPFVRGIYNAQVALLPCHKQNLYRIGNIRENANNGNIYDVAALLTHFRNKGCYETGLPTKKEREKYSCILKYYKDDNLFLNDVFQNYASDVVCNGQAKEWVLNQLATENSTLSLLEKEDLYDSEMFLKKDFFQKERICFSIPYAEYSQSIRRTKYFRDCMASGTK
ncbi:MAG: hypothetical protein ACNI26_08080 [Terasakiella sp.]|uniref:hypothetical protein n=1 Tax=unclassified Terasakiella TaxID=2614952 RepID=UPI003AFFA450